MFMSLIACSSLRRKPSSFSGTQVRWFRIASSLALDSQSMHMSLGPPLLLHLYTVACSTLCRAETLGTFERGIFPNVIFLNHRAIFPVP